MQHIIEIHRTVLNPQQRLVQPTELSLLLVTITWGAILDTDLDSFTKAALADALDKITKLLIGYVDSVDKFLVSCSNVYYPHSY